MSTTDQGPTENQKTSIGTILLLVAVAALVIFIVQNRSSENIQFLWIDIGMPLWLLIVVAALLGAAIDRLVMWLMRRSKKKSASQG